MDRKVYVYRLDVDYPKGSLAPGWEPQQDWDYYGPQDGNNGFRWPQNRLCLSLRTAQRRSALFERYGAKVRIERSEQVVFTEPVPPNREQLRQLWIEVCTEAGLNPKIEIE